MAQFTVLKILWQVVVAEWLEDVSLDQKIRAPPQSLQPPVPDCLFRVVRDTIGVVYTHSDVEKKVHELRSRYTESDFVQVSRQRSLAFADFRHER